ACGLLTNAGEAFGWMRTIWSRQLALLTLLAVDIGVVRAAGLGVVALVAGVAIAQWVAYALTVHAFVRRGFLAARAAVVTNLSHALAAALAFAGAMLSSQS